MKKVVLIRHGESQWNRDGKLTGWADIDLTSKGIEELIRTGNVLKNSGFKFTLAHTSLLKRAIKSTNYILDKMDLDWISVHKTWLLNEKQHGALQGMTRGEILDKYGSENYSLWRSNYEGKAPIIEKHQINYPYLDIRYSNIPKTDLPLVESFKDVMDRTANYWNSELIPALKVHDEIMIVTHGNNYRGIVKLLKGISDDDILSYSFPNALPCVFEFDNKLNFLKDHHLENERK